MSKLLVNIPYLEENDFNSDSSLKSHVNNGKPVILMVQGDFCGYCSMAKPAFQELNSKLNGKVTAATLRIDGDEGEKAASKRIKNWDPNYRGVPVFLGFDSKGKFAKVHNGGRDVAALMGFANSLN